ncbi:MAG TPA: hypothetical protein VJN88_07500 [Ktedonobacterales bacterium]|nr:hypothetical protein [Ktedonobacterales bacterium]
MNPDIEAIEETLEILSDPELMAELWQSIEEIELGEIEDLDDVLAKLGWIVAGS